MSRRLALLLLLLSGSVSAADWPAGMSFIGLERGEWRLYVVERDGKRPRAVTTSSEPHTAAIHPESGRIAFVAADGALHEIDPESGEERPLLRPAPARAWTQPTYDEAGRLYAVLLKEGTSADTDIVQVTADGTKTVVPQRSAQFEPYASGTTLYYSSVQCTVGCGRIIQDVWRKNLTTGQARQLTRLNAIAREPVLSPDGAWVYFVSDRAGHYHIWRIPAEGGEAEAVTGGQVTDISPAFDGAGRLWFIRRSPRGVGLMRLDADGTPTPMPLPAGLTDVRALEIAR